MQIGVLRDLGVRVARIRQSELVRQNVILFAGGLVAGIGGLLYHAIAGRFLGPTTYGELASLIAIYALATAPAVILSVVLSRYAAVLVASNAGGRLGSLVRRTAAIATIPGLIAVPTLSILARPIAAFEHIDSIVPILILGFCIALAWQVAIPRGVLQGLQGFTRLSLNLALELVARSISVYALLVFGYAVSGAMGAVVLGLGLAWVFGLYSLRAHIRRAGDLVRLRAMAGFSVTAAAGIVGVQILFTQDIILAEHYLSSHNGGIYGGLNKIATIVFFFTLSVSQVLFPRVVAAVTKDEHPGRILLSSAGILVTLSSGVLVLFAIVPSLVVGVLFGPAFRDATPYVLTVGIIGLALALDNLLVQFFMAVHDRIFIPILFAAAAAEAILIVLFHEQVGQVVLDVLLSLVGLLVLLSVRCYLLLPTLHLTRVAEEVTPLTASQGLQP